MSLESVDKQNPHKLVPHNFDDFTVLALLRFALALKFKLNFEAKNWFSYTGMPN